MLDLSTTDRMQVWSCGGGTQSCAIASLIIQGKLSKPDIAVIADTMRECQSTWDYCDKWLVPGLKSIGVELQIITAQEWSYYHKTGHDLFNSEGTLQIGAYTTQGWQKGKLPGYCSSAWKQEPIDRWLRSIGIKKDGAVKWIGFGRDEQSRWVKSMQSKDYERGLIKYPLVHIMPRNRRECQDEIKSIGWPAPAPKSRCWMCPNQSDSEWREIKENRPEEFAKAVELEKQIHERDPDAWLHKSCEPLDQVDFSQPEDLFSRPCDSGLCFV